MNHRTPKPKELHDKAMEFADKAYIARKRGRWKEAIQYASRALELESKAAQLLPPREESEPTRSILYRSAASLAYQAGEYKKALELIEQGRTPYTPEHIQDDFRLLEEDIRFILYLQEQGLDFSPQEAHVILSGRAVGHGIILYKEFVRRLEALVSLAQRTAERLLGRVYRRGGPPTQLPFEPLIATAPPGSFGFKLRFAGPKDGQPALLASPQDILDNMLQALALVQEKNLEALREHFNASSPNPEQANAYLLNFLAGAKQILPDGERIERVRIASPHRRIIFEPQERFYIQDLLTSLIAERDAESGGEPTTIVGELDRADKKEKSIGITEEETGKRYTIEVAEGLEELVRTYFGEKVVARGILKGKRLYLHDLEPA